MIYNTGETSEELKAKYNPDGSVLRKAQLRMLDMLIYIDKVCKEQNIQYFLGGGNVLGAVRHGGYIPWDDDIDIILDYQEWERLVEYLKTHPHPQYKLQCNDTDPGFFCVWAVLRDTKSEYIQDSKIHNLRKYRGLQVDLFPFDSSNIFILRELSFRYVTYFINNNLKKGRVGLAKLFYKTYKYFLLPLMRTLNFCGNKKNYSHTYGADWTHENFDIDVIKPYKPLLFEGIEFMGPADPDAFLRGTYGDYMKLPPLDKRDHHEAVYKIWD